MANSAPVLPASVHLPEGVCSLLGSRGIAPEREPDERRASYLDRLDTELMALFRDTGSDEAFEALYRHSRSRVLQWVRWLVSNRRSALDPVDLLQDTFVNVYRYAHSFRSDHRGSFRSWVRTIAANVLRRAQSIVSGAGSAALPSEEPADPRTGPHLRMVYDEEKDALTGAWVLFLQHYAQAYDSLSDRDRRALTLIEIEGLSYAQAAVRLGVGSSNMKMIMLRSRRRLLKNMRAAMLAVGERVLAWSA